MPIDDDVFKALADPSRRELLDSLKIHDGQTLRELSEGRLMVRQSVSKHLGILESANLITTIWRGREKLHYLNAEPINAIHERWISKYNADRITALADLKLALEEKTMESNSFVYTTYIEAPPELVWQGITDPAFTRRYWGMEFETDWTPGSPIAFVHSKRGVRVADDQMIIKEYDPFRRLSFTWEAYTQELGDAIGFTAEFLEHAAKEPRSTASFDLSVEGDQTRLTVTHSGFSSGSVVFPDISGGWPKVMSWLKSFLESGRYRDSA
jgi:uncharacterized protein YndB with AHSA1/START domain/DNA-binding transcriptional ArsR family regulator